MMRSSRSSGVTLIEVMVAVAIVGMIALIAWPSYQSSISKSRLSGAVEILYQDLQLARSLAIKTACKVTIAFTPSANSSWNYQLARSTSCDSVCTDPECAPKTVNGSQYKDIYMSAASFTYIDQGNTVETGSIDYDPVRSILYAAGEDKVIKSGSIDFSTNSGVAVSIKINGVGKVSICTVSGGGGYPACP